MIPSFPKEAKPHEVAILLCYSLGKTSAKEIVKILPYKTKQPVYAVLRKYKSILPGLRLMCQKTRYIGPGIIGTR